MKKILWITMLAMCGALPMHPAHAEPSDDGDWTEPFPLPLIAIHAAMLPTGKVLLFSAEHGVPGIHGWVLDPDTLELTNVQPPAPWNPDCAGHSFLADGRLLVAGGTLGFNPTRGPVSAYIFNSFTEQWAQIEDMRSGRWYPTNITLPDGRVITISGLNDSDGSLNSDVELWDPQGTSNWELLGQKTVPYYPYLHVLSDGKVFRSGPDSTTETYDPSSNQWTFVANRIAPGRYEAPSVLLPPGPDRVMVMGGNNLTDQPTSSAEVIDLRAPAPQWSSLPPMIFQRMDFNAAILPDGKIFVVGGRSDFDGSPTPNLTPEIFDPQTTTWEAVEPHQIPRRYHSTAILLPDARVLVAGGDFQPSGEIYSPPYLFQGSRPVIESAPKVIQYGGRFDLQFTSATSNNKVALIRFSSVTHSINMGQRYAPLGEFSSGSGTYLVDAPANANLAPPGYYMLFVVDGNGVPSVSATVQVTDTAEVSGRATSASIGVAGARVTLFNESLGYFEELRTGSEGWFSFGTVPVGTYRLGVAQPGMAYVEQEVAISTGGGDVVLPVPLVAESEQGRWTVIGDTAPEFIRGTGSGSVLPNGRILICHDTEDPIIIDPADSSKFFPPPSGSVQGCHAISLRWDGGLFFVGGSMNNGNPQDPVVKIAKSYFAATNSWSQDSLFNVARWYPALVPLPRGDYLLIGGEQDGAPARTDTCEIYDADSKTWTMTGSVARPTEMPPSMLLYTGEVLKSWREPELWNPTTGQWRATGPPAQVRPDAAVGQHSDHSSILLPDGRVALFGIIPEDSDPDPRFVELYDPGSDSWSEGSNPELVRVRPETILLPDGHVIAMGGGYTGNDPGVDAVQNGIWSLPITRACDLYDPATDTWRAVAPMNRYIHYHNVSVLLADGRVLATGGAGNNSVSFGDDNSVEAYEPPYLFRGVRPQIDSVSARDLRPGDGMQMTVSRAKAVTAVKLCGLRAATHWIDGGPQRQISLPFVQVGDQVAAVIPDDEVAALNGYYYVFVMVDDIPSVGEIVRVLPPRSGGDAITLSQRIAASADDAEERPTGSHGVLDSTDLELTQDGTQNQTIGLRFPGLALPRGVTILSADLQFTADRASGGAAAMTIRGEAADDAVSFTTDNATVSSRPNTAASVAWNPPAWTTAGEAEAPQRTPDLAALVSEVINRPGWNPGQAFAFVISGSGTRAAESFDGNASSAPLLTIKYLPEGGGAYDSYIQAAFPDAGGDPDIIGPWADPDFDGAVNAFEFASATDAALSDSFPGLSGELSGAWIYLNYTRRAGGQAEFPLRLYTSIDLVTWALQPTVETTSSLGAGSELVRAQIPFDPADKGRRFWRLVVSAAE